jgi:hypothetical protein
MPSVQPRESAQQERSKLNLSEKKSLFKRLKDGVVVVPKLIV